MITPARLYFGGSFDPLHNGHLYAAQSALEAVGGGPLLFVPTARNPLKAPASYCGNADRFAMAVRATATNEAFRVSDIEVRETGSVYTIDTVTRLIARGELIERPFLVIGDDLVDQLPRWHRYRELLERVRVVVVARLGAIDTSELSFRTEVILADGARVPTSSSAVRQQLQRSRSVRYLVPEAVYEYLRDGKHDHA